LPPGATGLVTETASAAPSVFVIMGAAVWRGGQPSNAMRRRVEGALISARGAANPLFLPSGGIGKHPPSEAEAMSRLLQEFGVPKENIVLDEASNDTLQSVHNCSRILRSLPNFSQVVVCSDVYHIPRCRWLFKLYGIPSLPGAVRSGRAQNKPWRWWYYYVREFPALVWDVLLVLISGRSL